MEEKKKFNKKEYDNRWIKENKERINFLLEKGTKARIEAASSAKGIKASEFLRNAIEKALKEAGY